MSGRSRIGGGGCGGGGGGAPVGGRGGGVTHWLYNSQDHRPGPGGWGLWLKYIAISRGFVVIIEL